VLLIHIFEETIFQESRKILIYFKINSFLTVIKINLLTITWKYISAYRFYPEYYQQCIPIQVIFKFFTNWFSGWLFFRTQVVYHTIRKIKHWNVLIFSKMCTG